MTSCSQVAITMGLARVVSTANFLGEDVFINLLKLSRNLVTNSTACTQAASMGLLEQPSLRTGKGNAVPGPDFLGVRTQLPAARTNHSRTQSTGTPTRSLSSLSHPIPFPSTEMCVVTRYSPLLPLWTQPCLERKKQKLGETLAPDSVNVLAEILASKDIK